MLGRLHSPALRRNARELCADSYQHVEVRRGRQGAEAHVTDFQTRIAAATNAVGGLDQITVGGASSPQMYVLYAPPQADIRKGDELWTGAGQRYRVVVINQTPGLRQIIAEYIQ